MITSIPLPNCTVTSITRSVLHSDEIAILPGAVPGVLDAVKNSVLPHSVSTQNDGGSTRGDHSEYSPTHILKIDAPAGNLGLHILQGEFVYITGTYGGNADGKYSILDVPKVQPTAMPTVFSGHIELALRSLKAERVTLDSTPNPVDGTDVDYFD